MIYFYINHVSILVSCVCCTCAITPPIVIHVPSIVLHLNRTTLRLRARLSEVAERVHMVARDARLEDDASFRANVQQSKWITSCSIAAMLDGLGTHRGWCTFCNGESTGNQCMRKLHLSLVTIIVVGSRSPPKPDRIRFSWKFQLKNACYGSNLKP